MNRYFEEENHATLYRMYRPKTPDFIAREIVRYVEAKRPRPLRLAVDVACGSGQNTFAFAEHFESVIGIDVSSAQIAEAEVEQSMNHPNSNVTFAVSSAEDMKPIVSDRSVDLVVGGMCFHWLDLPKFYVEVRRVLAPNGAIAAIAHLTWQLCHPTDAVLSESLSHIIPAFEHSLMPYTDPALDKLSQAYKDIPFPFEDKVLVELAPQVVKRTLSQHLGTLTTWSAYQRFLAAKPKDAVSLIDSVKRDVLRKYGYEESKDPGQVIIYCRCDYVYIMGRVR